MGLDCKQSLLLAINFHSRIVHFNHLVRSKSRSAHCKSESVRQAGCSGRVHHLVQFSRWPSVSASGGTFATQNANQPFAGGLRSADPPNAGGLRPPDPLQPPGDVNLYQGNTMEPGHHATGVEGGAPQHSGFWRAAPPSKKLKAESESAITCMCEVHFSSAHLGKN